MSRNWGFTPFPKDVFQEGRTGTIEWRGDPPDARRCLLIAVSCFAAAEAVASASNSFPLSALVKGGGCRQGGHHRG